MAYSYSDLTYGNTPVLPKSDLKEPLLVDLNGGQLEIDALSDAIEDLIWAEAQMEDFTDAHSENFTPEKWSRVSTSTRAAMHGWLWDNIRIATFALKLRSQNLHRFAYPFGEKVEVTKCTDDTGNPQLQTEAGAHVVTYDLECP